MAGEQGKKEECGEGRDRGCWSSIEISFNWAFCGFNWKLCFLLLLLLIEAAASAPSAAAFGCYDQRSSSSGNHYINKQQSTKAEGKDWGGRRRCNQRARRRDKQRKNCNRKQTNKKNASSGKKLLAQLNGITYAAALPSSPYSSALALSLTLPCAHTPQTLLLTQSHT